LDFQKEKGERDTRSAILELVFGLPERKEVHAGATRSKKLGTRDTLFTSAWKRHKGNSSIFVGRGRPRRVKETCEGTQ